MIHFEKKERHIDEKFNGALVRRFANTRACGYLSALNISPSDAPHADLLNLDIVLSELPRLLAGKFDFEYAERRIARRAFGLGKFVHMHLLADQQQLNQLISKIGKKIKLAGDEIAIERCGQSWFFVDKRSLDWLGIQSDSDHELAVSARRILDRAINETQCHSIILNSIDEQSSGSQMSGHFAAAAAGVSGYGGQIAKNSMEKARKDLDDKKKQNDSGKARGGSKGERK